MKLLLLGGGNRQRELLKILSQKGYEADSIFDAAALPRLGELVCECDAVILPAPASRDGVCVYSDCEEMKTELLPLIQNLKGKKLFGGALGEDVKRACESAGVDFCDYLTDKSLVIKNAFYTAQGAVRLILENTGKYITGKRLLVTGFGNVGKAVSNAMKNIGTDVYVAARSEAQLSEALSLGYKTLNISQITPTVHIFDFFINTVPAEVFKKTDVGFINDGAVYIELASKPFGADPSHFTRYKKLYIDGSSLPGRFCPISSAQAVYAAIKDKID